MKTRIILLALMLCATWASAQWVQTNGPRGSLGITTLALHGSTVFAGTYSSGIGHTAYRSDDGGGHWVYAGNGLTNETIYAFAINDNTTFVSNGYKTYRSFDQGASWHELAVEGAFNTFAVIGSAVFGGSNGSGVYRSDDNGDSWYAVNTGLSLSISILISDGNRLYAGTQFSGVFLSENLGESWTKITLGTGLADLYVSALDVSGDTIIVGSIFQGIFLSTNNGSSWNLFIQGLISPNPFITALAINGTELYAVDATTIYKSTFNDPVWNKVAVLAEPGYLVRGLAIQGDTYLAGSDTRGVYKSDDGEVWIDANTGMPNGSTLSAIAIDGNDIFTSVKDFGVFRTSDKGNTWTTITIDSSITTSYTRDLFYYNNYLFAGTDDNGVFKSSDHGDTWVPANAGISDQFIYAFGALAPYLFVATDDGVFRSDNNGDTWAQVNNGLPGLGWLEVSSFTGYNGKLYVGLYGGDHDDYDNVYFTSDFGNTWTGIDDPFDDAFALTVCGQYLIAGTRDGAYRYNESTGQWNALPNGSSDYLDIITREVASTMGVLFSGSYGRSFLSYDIGDTWIEITDGLGLRVEVFEFFGTEVLAGPEGGGLFINTSLLTYKEDIPTWISDLGIHPNPASNSITIETPDLTFDAHLSIFNTNGQKVLDQTVTGIQNSVDISSLPSGIYFLHIMTDGFSQTQKLIIE